MVRFTLLLLALKQAYLMENPAGKFFKKSKLILLKLLCYNAFTLLYIIYLKQICGLGYFPSP